MVDFEIQLRAVGFQASLDLGDGEICSSNQLLKSAKNALRGRLPPFLLR